MITPESAALSPFDLAFVVSSGVQAAIGLTFTLALLGAAVSLRRPAMWSLSLLWALFTIATVLLGMVLVAGGQGASLLLLQSIGVVSSFFVGAGYPALCHSTRAIVDPTASRIPRWSVLGAWGVSAAALVVVLDQLFDRFWPALAAPTLIAAPRVVVALIAGGGAWHAWRMSRTAGESRRTLQLLAIGYAILAGRAPVNTIIALVTGNGPRFSGLTLVVVANIAAFVLVGVASLMAALGQERTAYLEQAEALKQSELRRSQGERLESLGRMAAGIAHDFNNLLTVIGHSTLMSRLDVSEREREMHLAEVEAATARAVDLTRQLLAFSRQQRREPEHLAVGVRLGGMVSMLRRLAGNTVEVEVEIGLETEEASRAVLMDPSQFDQIVFNLVANARDAMPGGGRLTITAGVEELRAPRLTTHSTLPAGLYVQLAFADTGEGMPAGVVNHIFEPFFTTKPADRGTGLGLSTVYGIVRQSQGDIAVWSAPGRGARFEILLPVAA